MPAEEMMFCETCGAQLEANSRYCGQCGMKVHSKAESQPFTEDTGTSLPALYHVYSVANKFLYRSIFYDNLKINWFVKDREMPQVPFETVIENYSGLTASARVHPENFVKELFTLQEAEALKLYLNSSEMLNAIIERCRLPVNEHASGYRDFPAAPGTDFIALHEKQSCTLPFKVEGIFNINMADEHVMADDHTTVVSGINVKEIQEYLEKKEKEKEKEQKKP
jgi:hypothetical protein